MEIVDANMPDILEYETIGLLRKDKSYVQSTYPANR